MACIWIFPLAAFRCSITFCVCRFIKPTNAIGEQETGGQDIQFALSTWPVGPEKKVIISSAWMGGLVLYSDIEPVGICYMQAR